MNDQDVLLLWAGVLCPSGAYHIKPLDPMLKILVIDKYVAAELESTTACHFRGHAVLVVGGGSDITKADAIGRIAAAAYAGKEFAILLGGVQFKVSDLDPRERHVDPEKLII